MADIPNIEIIETVTRYLLRVNEKFNIEKAYIFGSYAKGTANTESDIDIALISSAFSGNSFYDNVEAGILTWGIDARIEPVAFRPEDFNMQSILASEIIKTGVELKII
ncbi:MAG: nucleotidyltransferase domain-containing protein [Ignavibacteria bacterium]